ncbi:unnamed protein product [Vitrella brassicaformis CCMP3155]|uniref:Uncharacterized protein n=1 Tax=Vitrella brassicaformis (strain CCMP3155) TaxID=1169540 RepID=A0A0G4H450_VITBC|nr:unnamed protein product [Vitrella brassicaformis CCMP3155]|mmetsp:Transcript_18706/g.53610  ORF Transcript_18706/g.53610 Transcript_18706/m.53610 type:complete len:312 (+) Transcript_18706:242-1177(+)|eukprot:CEM38383.1 unnamed protein product [Vitrella brassicaformis CCMP3155]
MKMPRARRGVTISQQLQRVVAVLFNVVAVALSVSIWGGSSDTSSSLLNVSICQADITPIYPEHLEVVALLPTWRTFLVPLEAAAQISSATLPQLVPSSGQAVSRVLTGEHDYPPRLVRRISKYIHRMEEHARRYGLEDYPVLLTERYIYNEARREVVKTTRGYSFADYFDLVSGTASRKKQRGLEQGGEQLWLTELVNITTQCERMRAGRELGETTQCALCVYAEDAPRPSVKDADSPPAFLWGVRGSVGNIPMAMCTDGSFRDRLDDLSSYESFCVPETESDADGRRQPPVACEWSAFDERDLRLKCWPV